MSLRAYLAQHTYAQKLILNELADVSSMVARGIIFNLSLHLHPHCVLTNSADSHDSSLIDNTISITRMRISHPSCTLFACMEYGNR